MATILDMIFLIQLVTLIGLTIFRFYNIMNLGKIYTINEQMIRESKGKSKGISITIILFVSILLSWLFGLFVVMFTYENLIYSQIFQLETLLIPLNFVFLIIEIFFLIQGLSNKAVEAYNPDFKVKEF